MLLMMPNTVAGISLKLRFKFVFRERERERLYNLLRISNIFNINSIHYVIIYNLCKQGQL